MATAAPAPQATYSYDAVLYPSDPFPQSHPDRLATIAKLFGMEPPPITNCRVLELGSARGGNIIPLAASLPNSHFVGLDLSERQVAESQEIATAAGLSNIQLRKMNILEVDESMGMFDYIIVHGIYSWVPPVVQNKIMEICARQLTPNGVAYVSYNVYPGWHMRGTIRDMMVYHTRNFQSPQEKVAQARAILDFLNKTVKSENTPYGLLLKSEMELLSKQPDGYISHEHLEEVNDPCYFHQFNDRLASRGLRYLGEADFAVMHPGNYPPDVQETLRKVCPDQIHLEQYMDFLRNRTFRQSLIVHQGVKPNYTLTPQILPGFHVASPVRLKEPNPVLTDASPVAFTSPDGRTLTANEPLVKAAFHHLTDVWPKAVPFTDLRDTARKLVTPDAQITPEQQAMDTESLGRSILSAYATAFHAVVELHTWSPDPDLGPKDAPSAPRLAREQAKRGPRVTNLYHQNVTLSDFDRQAIQYMDGERDREGIVKEMVKLVDGGTLNLAIDGKPVTDKMEVFRALASTLDQQLPKIAKAGLLTA